VDNNFQNIVYVVQDTDLGIYPLDQNQDHLRCAILFPNENHFPCYIDLQGHERFRRQGVVSTGIPIIIPKRKIKSTRIETKIVDGKSETIIIRELY
jgi:hypothetical protein